MTNGNVLVPQEVHVMHHLLPDIRSELQDSEKDYNIRVLDDYTISDLLTMMNSSGLTDAEQARMIIWQQMPIKRFYQLLMTNCLYFRNLCKFSDSDERKLRFYREQYESGWGASVSLEMKAGIGKMLEEFEKKVYISCWYHSRQLSDIAFKEYANEFSGIAIGTKIGVLLDAIQKNSGIQTDSGIGVCSHCSENNGGRDENQNEKQNNIADVAQRREAEIKYLKNGLQAVVQQDDSLFYGNTAYLPDYCKTVVSPYDIVTPLFLKSQNHYDDKEFRLCYVDEHETAGEARYIHIGEVLNVIDRVAVRANDEAMLYLVRFLCEKFKPGCIDEAEFDAIIKRREENSPQKGEDQDGFITMKIKQNKK